MAKKVADGMVHKVPNDLQRSLLSSPKIMALWNELTLLARNEWICWIISVKKPETRKDHLKRARNEILKGKKRPCCWGAAHIAIGHKQKP